MANMNISRGNSQVNPDQDKNNATSLQRGLVSTLSKKLKIISNSSSKAVFKDIEDKAGIFQAIIRGDGRYATQYIQAGGNVNLIHEDTNNSLLHWACWKGHKNLANYLLEQKAQLELPGYKSYKPLHLAAENGHLGVVKLLIEVHHATVDILSECRTTSLHVASRRGHEDLCIYLCEKAHANINALTEDGFSPFMEACIHGNVALVDYFISQHHIDPNVRSGEVSGLEPTALHWACKKGMIGVAETLLNKRANPNLTDFDGSTPLHYACDRGHFEVVKILLKGGVDINVKNNKSLTAFHSAFRRGHTSVIQLAIYFQWLRPTEPEMSVGVSYRVEEESRNSTGQSRDQTPSPSLQPMENDADADKTRNTLAGHFTSVCRQVFPVVSLRNTNFLRCEDLQGAGKLPSYYDCMKDSLLVRGTVLNEKSNVLFISHRWDSWHECDKNDEKYKQICYFLKNFKGARFEYVWLDYSCIQRDQCATAFKTHLHNVSTALLASTHVLVVPATDHICSDLRDYLERAWCTCELLSGMMIGRPISLLLKYKNSDVKIHQLVNQTIPWKVFDPVENEEVEKRVNWCKRAAVEHYTELAQEYESKKEKMKLPELVALNHRWMSVDDPLPDPQEKLEELVDTVLCLKEQHPDIFAKVRHMGITLAEMEPIAQGFANSLGQLSDEMDRVTVLNTILAIASFALNLLPRSQTSMDFRTSSRVLGEENSPRAQAAFKYNSPNSKDQGDSKGLDSRPIHPVRVDNPPFPPLNDSFKNNEPESPQRGYIAVKTKSEVCSLM